MMMMMKQHSCGLPCYFPPKSSSASSSPSPSPPSSLRISGQRSHVPSCSQSKREGEYKGGMLDELLLTLFRNKMVEEVGWDSQLPGYDGLIQVANRLLITTSNDAQTSHAAVRILRSLFPPFLLHLFKLLIAPLAQGHLAPIMVARVTALSCQWLMGPCKINSIQLPNGHSSQTGVFVERCKYLEASKCVGICINTCKLPTQRRIQSRNPRGVICKIKENLHCFAENSRGFYVNMVKILTAAQEKRGLEHRLDPLDPPLISWILDLPGPYPLRPPRI